MKKTVVARMKVAVMIGAAEKRTARKYNVSSFTAEESIRKEASEGIAEEGSDGGGRGGAGGAGGEVGDRWQCPGGLVSVGGMGGGFARCERLSRLFFQGAGEGEEVRGGRGEGGVGGGVGGEGLERVGGVGGKLREGRVALDAQDSREAGGAEGPRVQQLPPAGCARGG